MSFKDSFIVLDNPGYCLVSGNNKNVLDNASSNGSGKSSVWESILWGITGETIRGSKNVTRIGSEDGCYVILEFSVDNNHYKLIRSKDSKEYKTNLKIYINGEDKSGKGIRDSEKLLLEYLPDVTSSLIGSVILLGQGLPHRFTNNSPSGRKDVLEKLSKSDFMIQDLKERISERKTYLQNSLRTEEDSRLTLQSENNAYNSQILSLQQELQSMNGVDISSIDEKIYDLNLELAVKSGEIISLNEEIEKLKADADSYKSQLMSIDADIKSEITDINNEYQIRILDVKDKINRYQSEMISLNKEIDRLDNISDICPTCGQKLIGVEKPDTSDLKSRREEVNFFIKELSSVLTELQGKISSKIEDVKNNYAQVSRSTELNLHTCEKDIFFKGSERDRCSSEERELSKEIQELSNKKTLIIEKKDIIEKQIVSNNEKIENNILYINSVNEKINSITNKLAIVSKFDTLIKRDFRGYLLKNVIDFIDERAKFYSHDIFKTDKISFSLDGNNISITYLGKEYESLSGGEKQKVDIIVQFSIRDMLCSLLNFSSNILVLDEVTDNLDSVGCDNIINLISSRLKDVSTIYIISHRKDLNIPYDRELKVEKNEDGISNIIENAL